MSIAPISAAMPTSAVAPAQSAAPAADAAPCCAPKSDGCSFSQVSIIMLELSGSEGGKKKDKDLALIVSMNVGDLRSLVQSSPLLQLQGDMVSMAGAVASIAGAAAPA